MPAQPTRCSLLPLQQEPCSHRARSSFHSVYLPPCRQGLPAYSVHFLYFPQRNCRHLCPLRKYCLQEPRSAKTHPVPNRSAWMYLPPCHSAREFLTALRRLPWLPQNLHSVFPCLQPRCRKKPHCSRRQKPHHSSPSPDPRNSAAHQSSAAASRSLWQDRRSAAAGCSLHPRCSAALSMLHHKPSALRLLLPAPSADSRPRSLLSAAPDLLRYYMLPFLFRDKVLL